MNIGIGSAGRRFTTPGAADFHARISGGAQGAALTLALLLLAAVPAPAAAQDTAGSQPGVKVDLSVIDALPPKPAAPGEAPIRLRPPGATAVVSPPSPLADTAPPPASPAASPMAPAASPAPPPEVALDQAIPPLAAALEAEPAPATAASPEPEIEPGAAASRLEPRQEQQPPTGAGTQTAAAPPAPLGETSDEPEARVEPAVAEIAAVRLPNPLAELPAGEERLLTIGFAPGAASLDDMARQQLDQLAELLLQGSRRLQLKAFAGQIPEGANPRRLSLSRALAIRAHLIGRGLHSTRMDLRAIGPDADGDAPERVDVILLGG